MHGRKESQNLIVKLSNAHSQVAKSLKAQLLQDEALSKAKSTATLHTLLKNKPASME